jgi:hypothetical protein
VTLPEREQIEQALLQLRGVEGVRVCLDDEGITEIHVVAAPGLRAKNVARDVRSYLMASQGIDIHHRKISVAVRQGPRDEQPALETEPEVGPGPRVQFRSVNILVEGLRSEVQVELVAEGRVLTGCAAGVPASLGTERLVAAACVDALGQLLPDSVRLMPGDLVFTRLGPGEAILAEVVIIRPRWEQRLIGACAMGPDRYRSIVFAVLDALNRILGRLSPGHWVEYRVAPDVPSKESEGSS